MKDWELVQDCLLAGHGVQIMDLEDAANVEELCKVREEKAELRVRGNLSLPSLWPLNQDTHEMRTPQ